jgi:hypothetical protein
MLLMSTHPFTIEFDRLCIAWHQDEAALDELRETSPYFAALVIGGSSFAWLIGSPSSHASAVPRWTPRTLWNSFKRSRLGTVAPTDSSSVLAARPKATTDFCGARERAPQGPPLAPPELPGSATGTRTPVRRQAPQQQVRNTAYDRHSEHVIIIRTLVKRGSCNRSAAAPVSSCAGVQLPRSADAPVCCAVLPLPPPRCNRSATAPVRSCTGVQLPLLRSGAALVYHCHSPAVRKCRM